MTKKSTQRLKFSAERIRALPCSDGKTQYFYDIDCKGLALSVGKSGQKSFLLYKKVRGKPRRIAIGPFPEVSVELARTKALKLAGDTQGGLAILEGAGGAVVQSDAPAAVAGDDAIGAMTMRPSWPRVGIAAHHRGRPGLRGVQPR